MGLTILENLADKKPCGRHTKNESLSLMYELVSSHRGEIEEALERGYSWKQIDEACRVSWQEQSDKACDIYMNYEATKKALREFRDYELRKKLNLQ